jgi:hypothetical protein
LQPDQNAGGFSKNAQISYLKRNKQQTNLAFVDFCKSLPSMKEEKSEILSLYRSTEEKTRIQGVGREVGGSAICDGKIGQKINAVGVRRRGVKG